MTTDDEQKNMNLFQRLAHNEPKIRQETMKTFRTRLAAMDDIEEFDAMRIWKGFFFCMWMSDKPHVQQELARTLAASIHMFKPAVALKYYSAFLQTMAREYLTLDSHRTDKFLSLIRRSVESMFIYCRSRRWNLDIITAFGDIHKKLFDDGLGFARPVVLFVAEIYIQSWAKAYSQDIFFRQLTEEESKEEEEEEHIFIDMDNNDVEAAIAEASKVDVSAMSWESFRGLFEPLLVLLRFTSDSAIVNTFRSNVYLTLTDILRRLAEHVTASSEEDEDEDSESSAPAPRDTDALAATLIEVIHDFLAYIQNKAEALPKLTQSARTSLMIFHAQMQEATNILIEMGVVEEPKPKEKAKKAKKAKEEVSTRKKAPVAIVEKQVVVEEAAPVAVKKTKKAKKVPVEEVEEEEEEIPTLVVAEPVKKKKKATAVEAVPEPVAVPAPVAAAEPKKKKTAAATAPVAAPESGKKKKAAAAPVEEEEVVANPPKKAKKTAIVEEDVVVPKKVKKDDASSLTDMVSLAHVPTSKPKPTVRVIDSLGEDGLRRRVSFGHDDVKRFFKKVPPTILDTPTKDMLGKVAGKGLLKRK